MSADYTQWPLMADVLERLMSVGVTPRNTGQDLIDRVQQLTDQVTAEAARLTLRQFIADTAPTTRTYDGNGTAALEIDEFIAFVSATAIGLQADPGYPLDNVTAVAEQNKPMSLLIRGQGGLPAFPVAAVYQPVPTIFPAGRQNIVISAQFGYGATIPMDLWNGVCGEIARRLLDETLFVQSGRVIQQQRGDQQDRFALPVSQATGWRTVFEFMLRLYKRPSGRRLRSLRPRMI